MTQDEKMTSFLFRLSKDLKQKLEKRAQLENKSVNATLQEIVSVTLMTIWRKSPYFSEGMDSLSLGLVESYFLYALYFWSLIYLSTTSLLMLPREPR